jgi:hypothetical protein
MKNKGMQLGAMLAAVLLLSMAFVPMVSASSSNGSDKLTENQKKQVAEALATLKSAQSEGQVTTQGTIDILISAVDALRTVVSVVKYSYPDSRLDQAYSELGTARNLLVQNDIDGAVLHINSALGYLWSYVYDKGSQLPGWLYQQLVNALNYMYSLIEPYL